MFRFSQNTRVPQSNARAPALRTFDQHSATCARSVLPAGSAAHNSVLGCVYGKARSAAHTGVLKQLGSCNRKLSAVPASTRSGRCFQSQKQRNCSSPGQGECISRRSARSAATRADRCLPAKQGPGDPVAPARQVHFPAVCAVHSDARNLHMELHKVLRLPRNLHLEVHNVLCLPRNLRMDVHKVLRLPRNLHMDVHKVLHLPRNLDMEVHKVLRLPRNLHFKKQAKTLIPMDARP